MKRVLLHAYALAFKHPFASNQVNDRRARWRTANTIGRPINPIDPAATSTNKQRKQALELLAPLPNDMLATAKFVLQREKVRRVLGERASSGWPAFLSVLTLHTYLGSTRHTQSSSATATSMDDDEGDGEDSQQAAAGPGGKEKELAHKRLLRALRDGRPLTPNLLVPAGLRPLSPSVFARAGPAAAGAEEEEEEEEEEGEGEELEED